MRTMSWELDDTITASAPTSTTTAPLAPGGVFAGRYEVQAQIGQGGMGTVYCVRDQQLDVLVALKLLTLPSERASARFRSEVLFARRVTHHNVARTYDLGEHEGLLFLTMEYVRGTPLDDVLKQQGSLPLEKVMDFGAQIASGLEAAHAAGVVHRDLKPANVMIAEDGRVVLTDFGIARAVTGDTRTHDTGAIIGTPHYMAPEQITGEKVDARTDLYALGVILYELVTGTMPFDGDNPIAIAVLRLSQVPEDPRQRTPMPDSLAELILRCLARDSDARLQSATAVREWLRPSASATSLNPSGSASAHLRSSTTTGASLYAPIASRRASTLAILPFTYRGPGEHDYLGDGLAEELIDVLSRTKGLRVLAFGAIRRFGKARDPGAVRAELGADVLVDGTVQLSGTRVRLAARLVDTEQCVQRWSDRFDGDVEDVFAMQESMGLRVAEALRVEIGAAAYRHRAPPEALELYLRARRELRSGIMTHAEAAVRQLEESIALAPDFAPAIAAHAFACIRAWWGETGDSLGTRAVRARRSVARAREEAGELAETHLSEAMLAVQTGEFQEAAQALHRALEIAPTMAEANHYLGGLQVEAGRESEGLKRLQLALQLDPTLNAARFGLTRTALLLGKEALYQESLEGLIRNIPSPTGPVVLSRMRWHLYRDEYDDARGCYEMLKGRGGDAASQEMALIPGVIFGETSVEVARAAVDRMPSYLANPRFQALMHQVACEIFAFSGHPEIAKVILTRAADGVLIDLLWLKHCPVLEPLRGSPEMAVALEQVERRAAQIWRR